MNPDFIALRLVVLRDTYLSPTRAKPSRANSLVHPVAYIREIPGQGGYSPCCRSDHVETTAQWKLAARGRRRDLQQELWDLLPEFQILVHHLGAGQGPPLRTIMNLMNMLMNCSYLGLSFVFEAIAGDNTEVGSFPFHNSR